eukprot:17039-Amphidinium_carterae.1
MSSCRIIYLAQLLATPSLRPSAWACMLLNSASEMSHVKSQHCGCTSPFLSLFLNRNLRHCT